MNVTEWLAALGRSFGEVAARVQLYLPSVLGAVGLLVLGWLVGRLLRAWAVRLVALIERRLERYSVRVAPTRVGVDRSAGEVVGAFVFWAVFVIFMGAATDALGLPVLATWLSGLSQFLPRLLLAALIVLAGVLAGALARDALTATTHASGVLFGPAIARGTQVAIVTAAAITAVDQVGIDSRFLTGAIMVALAAFLGGSALAFGLGARTAESNIIAVHYIRQAYQIGQRVRLGTQEGTIQAITATAVVLDTPQGRVMVPAKAFGERTSTLLSMEG
jgi:small-conductance mechanosensitive channel